MVQMEWILNKKEDQNLLYEQNATKKHVIA